MRQTIEEQLQDRRLELEFDELTGRATAPDRLHEILARSRREPIAGESNSQATTTGPVPQLVAAALVVLALGVTATIFLWKPRDVVLESTAVTSPDLRPAQGKQGVQGEQGKQGKSSKSSKSSKPDQRPDPAQKPPEVKPRAEDTPAVDQSKQRSPTQVAPAKAAPVVGDPTGAAPVAPLAVDPRQAAAVLRLRTLLGQRTGADRALSGKPRVVPPADKAADEALEVLLRVRQAQDRGRGALGRLISGPAAPRGPMRQGEMGKVMTRLERTVSNLGKAGSADHARKVLDQLQRDLDHARRAIWELRQQEKQEKQDPTPDPSHSK